MFDGKGREEDLRKKKSGVGKEGKMERGTTTTMKAINGEIVMDLQERGIAAPSTTTLKGEFAIRVNITNHRTTFADLDILLNAIVDAGRKIA